jgi:uncharacterized protein YjbI with pentapeptide repeats
MDKFTNKYIGSFDILKKAILGFEFEFYTDKSYYKLLELLNRELHPIKVHGRRKYHSDMDPDEHNFKIEPDLSMGNRGVELITGPMPYHNAKLIMLKIMKILQQYTKTDDKCSMHINVSFDKDQTDKTLDKLNKLKLILNTDEELVFKFFPTRKDNFYSKSVKRLIPFKGYDYVNDAVNILIENIQLPDTKYYGINIKEAYNGRLEFRYIGDKDYQFKTRDIIELMDYFISLTWNSINEKLDNDDIAELRSYLEENINNFKNFTRLENFIAEFPTIQIEVDKDDGFIIVKSYYSNIYGKIYDVIKNIYNLSNCILNWDTESKRLEIVDADFQTIFDLDNISVIDSNANGGTYNGCIFINAEIKNAHLHNCTMKSCDIYNCKMENTDVDQTCMLKNCYFYGGKMDGNFVSGIFRSGRIGDFGNLGDDVRIVTDMDSYFNTSMEEEEEMKKNQSKPKKLNPFQPRKFLI